jgi:hypothetical protein
MSWSARDRDASVGEIAAVTGGAALLTGSWIVVAQRDDVPQLEQRVFVAVNRLPASLWPVLWAPAVPALKGHTQVKGYYMMYGSFEGGLY